MSSGLATARRTASKSAIPFVATTRLILRLLPFNFVNVLDAHSFFDVSDFVGFVQNGFYLFAVIDSWNGLVRRTGASNNLLCVNRGFFRLVEQVDAEAKAL